MNRLSDMEDKEVFKSFVKKDLKAKTKAVVMGLYQNEDHISLKIHQTLQYLAGTQWQTKGDVRIEELLDGLKLSTYDDVVKILPPPIYHLDVTFEKARRRAGRWHGDDVWEGTKAWGDESRDSFRLSSMSSGERQVLGGSRDGSLIRFK